LDLVEKNAMALLGREVANKYGDRFPFLFKVLAAAKPLSIQAHPSLDQAKEGYEFENRLRIPLGAPERNYRDDCHKPECLCALTPFWALKGFRKITDTVSLAHEICPKSLAEPLEQLRRHPGSSGLRAFFGRLMTASPRQRIDTLDEALQGAHRRIGEKPEYEWMLRLHAEYPGDIGVLFPLFLNLIYLRPGEAVYLPAGELHSYLEGVGIELMANSDNVLRGGLTAKHVDVPGLLKVLNFQECEIEILEAKDFRTSERVYQTPASEFRLSVISVQPDLPYLSPAPVNGSVEILLCTLGAATIQDLQTGFDLCMPKGSSVLVPAAVERYAITGNATLYKAWVPV
jgi:mannose-6-phosphate isomerase